LLLAIAEGRDVHLDLLGCEKLSQGVRIVDFIGNNGVKMERGQQQLSLGHIMAFTTSQDERQGKAKGIDEEMELAAESASAPTKALFLLRAPFFDPPAAHLWARTAVLSSMTAAMSGSWANCLNMSAQDAVLFPTCAALEYTVPLAITVWQFTPLGAGAQNPVNCLNETTTLFLLPRVGTRVSLQKCV